MGFDSRQGQETFVFTAFRQALRPPIQWVSRATSPEVTRSGRVADHKLKDIVYFVAS
jgi:hypothetical protein